MKALIVIAAVLSMTGCATFKDHETTTKLAVNYATMKYIEKAGDSASQVARAVRVRNVATQLLAVAGSDSITIALLKTAAMSQLPPGLTPADRALASALIDAAVDELLKKIGDGVLTSDAVLQVKTVIGWIVEATAYYE